jgi:hypothetical protein
MNYLSEYFRRAGFEVVEDAAAADYRIEGQYSAHFLKVIQFEGVPVAHTYEGSARISIRKGAEEVERAEVTDFRKDGILAPGVPEDQVAVLEMRRHLAKVLWSKVYHQGKTFSEPEVPALLESLAREPGATPVQGESVLKSLVAKRLAAVPYLLEALSDERPVQAAIAYPGVTVENPEKLHVYHLADKALEEIFQKVSRMELETPAKTRFLIIRGWENEWRKFCPSYRESPRRPKEAAEKDGAKLAPPVSGDAAKGKEAKS